MKKLSDLIANIYLRTTGYTYSNLGRLFMRLFVGIMFMQFGIRHLVNFQQMKTDFPSVIGLDSETCLILMICIELICSLFIMIGFLTRLSTIPPIITMVFAEYYIAHDLLPRTPFYYIDATQPGYLPIMFIGIYLFMLLAGPGKISLDYFISLYIIKVRGHNEEEALEEV